MAFVNEALGELLESNLTLDDFSTFIEHFSVHDVIDRTERLTELFGRSNLKSINILREEQVILVLSLKYFDKFWFALGFHYAIDLNQIARCNINKRNKINPH